jgi:uncharacterized protein involved in exopolysaccharide biosynthesis
VNLTSPSPTNQDLLDDVATDAFTEKVRSVEEDKVAGIVRLSIRWPDPRGASQIANDLLADANEEMRQRARSEGEQSIKYLQQELEKTPEVSLRQGLYQLAERESGKVMFANIRKDYAFRVIDPAVAPQIWMRDSPHRVLWAVGFAALGLLLAGVASPVLRRRLQSNAV